jgi:hypothetical protein
MQHLLTHFIEGRKKASVVARISPYINESKEKICMLGDFQEVTMEQGAA